jgi:hypothetical protein
VESGHETEQKTGKDRCGRGVRQDLAVNGNLRQPGQFSRRERLKQIRAEDGEHQPRGTAEQPQHEALGQQLTHQPSAVRAEGGADRELALPRCGACQQQVRDVGAGDQQDETHRAKQNEQRPFHIADQFLMQRNQPDPDPGVRRILLLEARGNRIHLGLGRRACDARLQPADDRQPVRSTGGEQSLELPDRRERHPELGVVGMLEARGHHAQDFVRHTVQHDALADDGNIRAKPPHPEPVGEDDHALAAGLTVRSSEGASLQRLHTHRLEEFMGDASAADLRRIAALRQRDARAEVAGHPLERLTRAAPVVEIRIGSDVLVEALPGVVRPHHHQAVRVRVGQRLQEHAVDHREDGRVRADAQAERQNHQSVEERLLRDVSKSVPNVRPHRTSFPLPSTPRRFVA